MKRVFFLVMVLVLIHAVAFAGTINVVVNGAASGGTYTARVYQVTGSNAAKWYCNDADDMQTVSSCTNLDWTATEENGSGATDKTAFYRVNLTDADLTIGEYKVLLYDASNNLTGIKTTWIK